MRVLVVSDIHAMSREIEKLNGYHGNSGGILRVEERTLRRNPLLSVPQALKDMDIQIDLLLCLGDLTHQAKHLPLMAAWHDVNQIGRELNIESVVGIIGNHDVASRADTPSDVEALKEFLHTIEPSFPTNDQDFSGKYFASGVASKTYGDCLLVALDSCRTHGLGYGADASKQIFEVGQLTSLMIDRMLEEIDKSEKSHVLVALHHHPMTFSAYDGEPEDRIPLGNDLLAALEGTTKNVLVIHGHKHLVRLKSFSALPRSPVVFSSASLSAMPFPGGETKFSNQFHVVDLDTSVHDRMAGEILSWDWGASSWEKSTRAHMPHRVHFGTAPDLQKVAGELTSTPDAPFIEREQLDHISPDLKYVRREQITELNELLVPSGRRLIMHSNELAGMITEEPIK